MAQVAFEQFNFDLGIYGRLGKAVAKSHPKMLSASNYMNAGLVPPRVLKYWEKRKPLPILDYGNNEFGDCTIASQGLLSLKMELQERRRLIEIPKDNIVKAYFNMTARLYGGGDTGAYEIDALSNWRNPDYTFRDSKGNPVTIDAYTKVNHGIIEEVKKAIFLAPAKAVKVCFALPRLWQGTLIWDIPDGQLPVGEYAPYSLGGHSMSAAEGYDDTWLYLNHTWKCPNGKISWKAFSIYCDESFMVIDSVNSWKKRLNSKDFKASALISDVNDVSSLKIK